MTLNWNWLAAKRSLTGVDWVVMGSFYLSEVLHTSCQVSLLCTVLLFRFLHTLYSTFIEMVIMSDFQRSLNATALQSYVAFNGFFWLWFFLGVCYYYYTTPSRIATLMWSIGLCVLGSVFGGHSRGWTNSKCTQPHLLWSCMSWSCGWVLTHCGHVSTVGPPPVGIERWMLPSGFQ